MAIPESRDPGLNDSCTLSPWSQKPDLSKGWKQASSVGLHWDNDDVFVFFPVTFPACNQRHNFTFWHRKLSYSYIFQQTCNDLMNHTSNLYFNPICSVNIILCNSVFNMQTNQSLVGSTSYFLLKCHGGNPALWFICFSSLCTPVCVCIRAWIRLMSGYSTADRDTE